MDREIDSRRFRRYELEGGWTVLAGKTDADNEFLSLRFAKPKDYWFHASGCPGSHVLLLQEEGREPDATALRGAASVAAWHSKARNAKKVPVSVTRGCDVTKTRGSPVGEVTIRRAKTLKVSPGLPPSSN